MQAGALRRWLAHLEEQVHLAPDAVRESLTVIGHLAERSAADDLYPRACVLMGHVALATGDHALAEAPLRAGFAAARARGDLAVMTHASAALGHALAPTRFTDHADLRQAEVRFAHRLAVGADPLSLIAARVRLDLRRAATPGPVQRLITRERLPRTHAVQLGLAWAMAVDPQLAPILGPDPAAWTARLAPWLPPGPARADVIALARACEAAGAAGPPLRDGATVPRPSSRQELPGE